MCKLNNKCPGKAKINKIEKLFIITNECDKEIEHEIITFEEFENYIKKNYFIYIKYFKK